jgi:antirestriction protein ArdC
VVGGDGERLRRADLDNLKPALELGANVHKGEHGSLVVYGDKIVRTETDMDTGEESEHAIPFMKGYTVFNV